MIFSKSKAWTKPDLIGCAVNPAVIKGWNVGMLGLAEWDLFL
jgi:hypothetical protein